MKSALVCDQCEALMIKNKEPKTLFAYGAVTLSGGPFQGPLTKEVLCYLSSSCAMPRMATIDF